MVSEQACKISHKWTQGCNKRLARLISYVHHTNDYRLHCHVRNTAQHRRLGLFQDSDFAGDLEDSESNSGGVWFIFGSRTFVPVSWMCKKQTSVSHSSTEAEIISLDAGLRMDGIPALTLWDSVIEVFHSSPNQTTKTFRWLKPFSVRTSAVFFLFTSFFWFCLVQVSTTQFCSFPSFLMASANDATDVPISPSPVSSSNMGSPNGSLPDLEGVGGRSTSTMEGKIEAMLTKRHAQFEVHFAALASIPMLVIRKQCLVSEASITNDISKVEHVVGGLAARVSANATPKDADAVGKGKGKDASCADVRPRSERLQV